VKGIFGLEWDEKLQNLGLTWSGLGNKP